MNKKQKVLTVIAGIVLIGLAVQYSGSHYSALNPHDGPNSEDLGIFIVSGVVLGLVYTGLFFVLKK